MMISDAAVGSTYRDSTKMMSIHPIKFIARRESTNGIKIFIWKHIAVSKLMDLTNIGNPTIETQNAC